jgi:hypothetical protein
VKRAIPIPKHPIEKLREVFQPISRSKAAIKLREPDVTVGCACHAPVKHDMSDIIESEDVVEDEWVTIDGTTANLDARLSPSTDMLCEPFRDSPDGEDYEGYMGNYGPDVTFWYHSAVIIMVPKFNRFRMATRAGLAKLLEMTGTVIERKWTAVASSALRTCAVTVARDPEAFSSAYGVVRAPARLASELCELLEVATGKAPLAEVEFAATNILKGLGASRNFSFGESAAVALASVAAKLPANPVVKAAMIGLVKARATRQFWWVHDLIQRVPASLRSELTAAMFGECVETATWIVSPEALTSFSSCLWDAHVGCGDLTPYRKTFEKSLTDRVVQSTTHPGVMWCINMIQAAPDHLRPQLTLQWLNECFRTQIWRKVEPRVLKAFSTFLFEEHEGISEEQLSDLRDEFSASLEKYLCDAAANASQLPWCMGRVDAMPSQVQAQLKRRVLRAAVTASKCLDRPENVNTLVALLWDPAASTKASEANDAAKAAFVKSVLKHWNCKQLCSNLLRLPTITSAVLAGDTYAMTLLTTRIAQLNADGAGHSLPFSWEQPDASLPEYPEIEEFLRGPLESQQFLLCKSIIEARRIVAGINNCYPPRTYSVRADVIGKYPRCGCIVRKTKELYAAQVARHSAMVNELRALKGMLPNASVLPGVVAAEPPYGNYYASASSW